jgi:hypothetical protein
MDGVSKVELQSGIYVPKNERHVTIWPSPDKDGDGPTVFNTGPNGERNEAKDANGNTIYEYEPPPGFENRRSSDGQDSWVRVDDRGQVVRTPTGEAIVIRPGQALVEHTDGTVEYINDDWEALHFSRRHDLVGEASDVSPAADDSQDSSGKTPAKKTASKS